MKWPNLRRERPSAALPQEQPMLSHFAESQSADANVRISRLEDFLQFALGDRRESFGEPEAAIAAKRLPAPLQRFYRFAGRWPAPYPDRAPVVFETPEDGFFFTGIAGSHLATLDGLREPPDGRIAVFREQSGNWTAFTEAEGDDPDVWISGHFGDMTAQETPIPSGLSLTQWLVTHCLAAIIWESGNHLCGGTSHSTIGGAKQHAAEIGLTKWHNREAHNSCLLWDATSHPCPELQGTFHLFRDSILIHDRETSLQFAALSPQAATEMRQHASHPQYLE